MESCPGPAKPDNGAWDDASDALCESNGPSESIPDTSNELPASRCCSRCDWDWPVVGSQRRAPAVDRSERASVASATGSMDCIRWSNVASFWALTSAILKGLFASAASSSGSGWGAEDLDDKYCRYCWMNVSRILETMGACQWRRGGGGLQGWCHMFLLVRNFNTNTIAATTRAVAR